ncbi:MAG TPA: VOC family protein [Thermoanaerobaculia bacterium]|nr:VOC family protein [Thermoanaerobaculia bacterium]
MATTRKSARVTAKSKGKVKGTARVKSKAKAKRPVRKDVPQFFRLSIEVDNLDAAVPFYSKLLDVQGRRQPGSRCYFECGPVTLSVLDVSSARRPHAAAKALYFTVKNLDTAFERAKALGCLSQESVHDAPGGGIVVRPWGERSFYAEDPWNNPLCFVEEGTVYTG